MRTAELSQNSTWINARIQKYGFEENVDFIITEILSSPNLGSSKSRPQRLKEYHLTTDMAKELAMVENNPKGRQARKYFIEVEKKANAPKTRLQRYEEVLAAALHYQEMDRKRATAVPKRFREIAPFGAVANDSTAYAAFLQQVANWS